jgi:mono/diheme cytochrome c family protein
MSRRWVWMLVLLAMCGCEASNEGEHEGAEPPTAPQNVPPVDPLQPPSVTDPMVDPPTPIEPLQPPVHDPVIPVSDPQLEVVIPNDDRAAVAAATPPPPISGGTLLVTADRKYAVAADPDRDRVSIVDLTANSVLASVALQAGDEPGRVIEDDAGLVHVALRRGGAVVSIDPATQQIVGRREVCANPRGMAFDAAAHELVIACASGQLMSLAASPLDVRPAQERARLEPDLRDVASSGTQTLVTRFKRAELLTIGDGGAIAATSAPAELEQPFPEQSGAMIVDSLSATFAWRTLRASDGSTFMLHQEARVGEIDLQAQTTSSVGAAAVSGPYGGGAAICGGVVQSAITSFDANGERKSTVRLPGVLPVDAAISADQNQIAVVFAGSADPGVPARTLQQVQDSKAAPTPQSGFAAEPSAPALPTFSVMVFNVSELDGTQRGDGACLSPSTGVPRTDAFEPTAVAALDSGFVVQLREPAALIAIDLAGTQTARIDLGGDSVADTGHQLFHHDAGGGVACASCHAEGGEDGHVWHFSGFGPRRTQALNVGLEGTAPFHWGGDMAGLPELMEEVLVTRMGGVHESSERQAALQRWLFALQPLSPLRAGDDLAAQRGKALFEGDALCSSCHTGEKLTNNVNFDVGTGESLQVPSLVGVAHRGPWLHTGCANTLRDRFDPQCGGETHGKTAELSDAQIDDLVAYLETL